MDKHASEGNFEDAVLVRRVQAGEVHAFTMLVTKYQDRVFNTCWRICGNHADAGELTQDAFLKAFEAIGGFHGKSAFYTWVFRIAVNQSLSWRRKQQKRKTVSLDAAHGACDDDGGTLGMKIASDEAEDPADTVEAVERQQLVTDALGKLDAEQRAVLVLRDIEGMDYQNIADILELAVGTVKSRIFRGRAALRELLCDAMSASEKKERFLT